MWMDPQSREDPIVLLSNLDGATQSARPCAAADSENPLQACIAGALQYFSAILVELLAFEMSVRIDVQRCPRDL